MLELQRTDPEIYSLIREEERYQFESVRLIPSENYASAAVMQAVGSVLTNKYSEGYPGKRYYEGQRYIDRMEKRDGKWGIVAREYIVDWVAPSINTIEGAKTPEGGPNYDCLQPFEFKVAETAPQPSRDVQDPSYKRPLEIDPSRVTDYKRLSSAAKESVSA